MTLSLIVAGRSTATFGTFEVADGNVSKNRKLILQFFNDTTALVPMDARSAFTTGEEHSAFDATLMALSTVGVSIQYVESIGKFMDPKARFKEWLEGKLTPASVGLSLSQEELAVPSAYESAKAKFISMFTAPTPPRILDERPVRDQDRLKIINRQGKPYQLSNGDYTIGVKAAQTLWNDTLKKRWATREADTNATMAITALYVDASSSNRRVQVYPSYINIGCQTIQRNVIEAIAQELGWSMD